LASVVDICNLSLGHLGDEAGVSSISPPDGSVQAAHCQRFYPIARDVLLQMHTWSFAITRKALALLSTAELPPEWAFAYAKPTCLRMVAVFPAQVTAAPNDGSIFDQSEFIARAQAYPFNMETLEAGTEVIYSNVESATGLFIRQVTDTTKFSPLVVAALARLLASYLAGPILKGKPGIEIAAKHLEWFEKVDGPRAKAFDAQAGRNTAYKEFIPDSLKARA